MKILIACEESGTLRDLFNAAGHDCFSCDLKFRAHEKHLTGDIFSFVEREKWDMMIAHPPCTRLTVAANGNLAGHEHEVEDAVSFFMRLANVDIPRIALENPIGIMSTRWRVPDQIIQPWQFGDTARKATCLWLKGLPKLWWADKDDMFSTKTSVEPKIVTQVSKKTGKKRTFSDWEYKASKDQRFRAEIRSKTFPGIAKAMVEQWGTL